MHTNQIHHKLYEKQNAEVCFSDEVLSKVKKIISRYPEGRQKSALLPVLHIAQEELGGYLTVDTMDYVAQLLNLQPIEVYEVATFYTQFYLDKVGKYVIEVCQTGSCAICGGEDILEYLQTKLGIAVGETTADGLFSLKTAECLGGCGYAPVMQINTEFYEHLTNEKIDKILDDLRQNAQSDKTNEKRWVEQFC